MKRVLSLLTTMVALIATSLPASAAKVNVTSAQTAAIHFFQGAIKNSAGRGDLTANLVYTKTEADNTIDFYVFAMKPGKGFVMISADDQVMPVIAYSTESDFKTPAQGSGVQCWMNHAGTHIYRAIQHQIPASQTITNQWAVYLQGQRPAGGAKDLQSGVAPLLTTTWDQEPFYNQLCPFNTADSMRCVTGCVATAMAQIMKFWNYPTQGTGSYGYLDGPPYYFYNYGDQYASFGTTTYNWAAMPDSLTGPNLPVATLMYHCGVAVAMGYGDDNQGGSGAYVLNGDVASWRHTAQMAYTSFFGYNQNSLQGVRETNYSAADWVSLIESELTAGRPVQYVGTDPNEGTHTWVCDGFDANNLLHMNWGWSGFDDGYYSISSLTGDGYNFSTKEEALIGIEPANNLNVTATVANAVICNGASTTLTAQGGPVNANFTWAPATGLSCANCATTTASPLATTVYTVTMDSAGYSAIATVTVTVSAKLNVESTEVTDVSCFGLNNGMAKVEISGGVGGYKYLWNNGGNTQSISNLVAGNYNVTVTDANGCTVSAATAITQPEILSASVNAADNVCSLENASLNVVAQGGTPSYSFIWSGGQTTISVSSPVAGNYTVSVFDAAGCSASTSFAVVQPTAVNVSIVSSNTSCSLLYGTATANVTGGNQNFSYAWSNGENTPTIADLTTGDFSVTVTDALGCSAAASQNFTQPDSMNVSIITSETVNNKVYGKATVNVTGGTPQYSYLWNTGANTSEISDLTPGTYSVTITDNKGCSKTASAQINGATGIGNLPQNISFEMFPNPAHGNVSIRVNDISNTTVFNLRNMLGQTMISREISSTQTQVDLSTMANGVYLVELSQGEKTTVKQLVISK